MDIPEFWAKATASDDGPGGRGESFSCWRSSDISGADAARVAEEAATRMQQKRLSGATLDRYGYGNMPLREEVVQRFTDEAGNTTAAVTRNQYGSLVLNTARAMFVDIDFPEASTAGGTSLSDLFGQLLGRKKPAVAETNESTVRERVERFVVEHRDFCARLYRTHSGMRLLMTHDVFSPDTAEVQESFAALGADPLYVRLCAAQESFRARLTPKPWRCGLWKPFTTWPFETPEAQAHFDKWQSQYQPLQAKFATCRYVATIGDAPVHPEIETVLQVHDHLTRCQEPLPLA